MFQTHVKLYFYPITLDWRWRDREILRKPRSKRITKSFVNEQKNYMYPVEEGFLSPTAQDKETN